MAKHSGERRDPSFGSWRHDNSETDVDEHDPLTWGKKRTSRNTVEDDLMEAIDAKSQGLVEEVEVSRSHDSRSQYGDSENLYAPDVDPELLARADKYFANKKVSEGHTSSRVTVSPKERDQRSISKEIRQERRYKKRSPSDQQISLDAAIRKAKDESLENRVGQ